MKYAKLLGVPLVAIMLVGCGDTHNSTVNVMDGRVVSDAEAEQAGVAQPKAKAEPKSEAKQAQPVTNAKNDTSPRVVTDNTSMTHVLVTAKDANIRSQPSLKSQVVTAGVQSDTYEYLKEKVHTSDGRTWYKVSYSHGVGYISSAVGELTSYDHSSSFYDYDEVIVIDKPDGNVRSEPSLNGSIIYKGKKGNELNSTGEMINSSDGRTWFKVNVNGKIGYISDRVSSLKDYSTYDSPSIFVISSKEGNVRSHPDIDSSIIYTGQKGDVLSYTSYYKDTSDGRRWYEVEVNGTTGYISRAVGDIQ